MRYSLLYYLPSFSEVKRSLDEHGSWTEGAEGEDEVSEVEFGLQVQLDTRRLQAILALPPRPLPCPAVGRRSWLVTHASVTGVCIFLSSCVHVCLDLPYSYLGSLMLTYSVYSFLILFFYAQFPS